jgi:Flp pilus assembly protein TadG
MNMGSPGRSRKLAPPLPPGQSTAAAAAALVNGKLPLRDRFRPGNLGSVADIFRRLELKRKTSGHLVKFGDPVYHPFTPETYPLVPYLGPLSGAAMTLGRIVKGLKATAARFVRAERGNVAMMFAITLPFLITAVGAAVDYSRAVSARTAMQAAADATALMISKEAANLTASEVTTKARAYFNALYTRSDVAGVVFNAAYSANSGNGASVTVSATGTLNTDLMKLAGVPTMPIGVSSTTKWGNQRYRVALALDNTG